MPNYPRGDTEFGVKCDRCFKKPTGVIMSFFNEDMCCLDCIDKEKAHPDYRKARDAELKELRKGNRNFPGIGKPDDL